MGSTTDKVKYYLQEKVNRTVLQPIDSMIDKNITDVVTTIGSFVIRSVRGKFQRSITFSVGIDYYDNWMEDALYNIIYKYNDIKKSSRVNISNTQSIDDNGVLFFRLEDGTHNLKYRKWNILLVIQSNQATAPNGRVRSRRYYTIITYNLDPEFVTSFERDMIANRNNLLNIVSSSPYVKVYQDLHEGDGYTYWDQLSSIPKRRLGTVYLPSETKKVLVDTINEFFANKSYYQRHGIPHNLKILLYGEPGPQPLDEYIPTPKGMCKMGDLKPGDYVFGYTGYPTKIEEIYEYNDLDEYEVEFEDGRIVRCAGEHNFPIINSKTGELIKMPVYDMIQILNHGNSQSEYNTNTDLRVPLPGAAEFPYKKVPIDPYVLGVFIGNGNLTQETLTLSAPNAIIPQIIANKYDFVLKHRSEDPKDYNWIFYHKDGTRVKTSEFFKDLPQYIGSKSGVKSIPDDYIFNTKEMRWALIQGLMDTDGSVSSKLNTSGTISYRIRYTSISKELITKLQFMVHSLGFKSIIKLDKRVEKYSTGYCANLIIQASDVDKILFFRYSHKVERVSNARYRDAIHTKLRFYDNKIIKITKRMSGVTMRCLHVENINHMYLTSAFCTCYNSGKDSIAKMIASEWNRNIYYCTGGRDGKFIPNALISNNKELINPLFIISDIDKYPFIVNEPEVKIDSEKGIDENTLKQKQIFGNMINALDGVLSGDDKIIIMTTNHIEKFSDVLLRPGRINLKLYISYANDEVLRNYIWDFYNKKLPNNIHIKPKTTVAEMQADTVFMKMTYGEFINKYCTQDKNN